MAVHLPRAGRRRGQSAGRSGGNPGQLPADLGDGDEFVLHPAARQPDLHDGRHDHPPEPAGGQAGRVSRVLGELQRRRVRRDAVCREGRAAGRVRRLGRGGARRRAGARRGRLRRTGQAEPGRAAGELRLGRARSCSSASSTRRSPVPKTRGRRGLVPRPAHMRHGGD